jgi:Domain of unknown function (DUF1902)
MSFSWRLGFPGWRLAAIFGVPLKVKIDVRHDAEAGVYFATSDDIGLAVEADSLDKLMDEIHSAMPVLLQMIDVTRKAKPKADIRLHDNLAIA